MTLTFMKNKAAEKNTYRTGVREKEKMYKTFIYFFLTRSLYVINL